MFQPNKDALNTYVELLNHAILPDTKVQRQVHAALDTLKQNADYSFYMAYIFANVEYPSTIRRLAGLSLKKQYLEDPYIDQILLQSLNDDVISNVAGSICSDVFFKHKQNWVELLNALIVLISTKTGISVVKNLFEDGSSKLLKSEMVQVQTLLEQICQCVCSNDVFVTQTAIEAYSFVISEDHVFVFNTLPLFVGNMLNRAYDDLEIRKCVCESIMHIIEHKTLIIASHIDEVIRYLIECHQNLDVELAKAASEVWSVLIHCEFCDSLRKHLPNLFPVLLNRMVYSDEELQEIAHDERVDTCKLHDEDDASWSLRKSSAFALDGISVIFPESYEILLPFLYQKLQSSDWKEVEAAILAIGAVAESMMNYKQLDQLIEIMLNSLSSKELIQSISAWSLSRYSTYIFSSKYKDAVINLLAKNCFSSCKKVQEASCCALCRIIEDFDMDPYKEILMNCFTKCLDFYGSRTSVSLYDCIGALADSLKSKFPITNSLFCLCSRFQQIKGQELIPLMECLTSIVYAVGLNNFEIHFEQCLGIIDAAYQDNLGQEFIIAGLDLIAAICKSCLVHEFLQPRIYQILSVIYNTMEDPYPGVRQSSLGLLGEVINMDLFCSFSKDLISRTLKFICNSDDEFEQRVTNNAIWVISESTKQALSKEIVLQVFMLIFEIRELSPEINKNCVIAFGRLGNVDSKQMSLHLHQFAESWCLTIPTLEECEEKKQSVEGFFLMLQHNPQVVLAIFDKFIWCLSRIESDCTNIIRAYLDHPDSKHLFQSLPASLQEWVELNFIN